MKYIRIHTHNNTKNTFNINHITLYLLTHICKLNINKNTPYENLKTNKLLPNF